jgi:uncharacterized protein YjbI with pentapeptide repeats
MRISQIGLRQDRAWEHRLCQITIVKIASLDDAQLQGASLDDAHLQGASLIRAQLQGASLDEAQLQGASLSGAQLQGASLLGAQLQGASLLGAQLPGALLVWARLQGASLDWAQLQGARLDGPGASTTGAEFQGASLANTALWRAQLTDSVAKDLFAPQGSPDWRSPAPVDWRFFPPRREPWTDATYTALRQSIERLIPEGQNRNNVLERMAILDCARQKLGDTSLASCDLAADPPDSVKEWKKMIEAAKVGRGTYAKALAAILGGLVCSNEGDRIYVLRGLLRSGRFRQTGAEMPALATRIMSPKCPVSTALTAADKTAIAEASKKTPVASSKSP